MREHLGSDLALGIIGISVAVWCLVIVAYAIARSSSLKNGTMHSAHTSFSKSLQFFGEKRSDNANGSPRYRG